MFIFLQHLDRNTRWVKCRRRTQGHRQSSLSVPQESMLARFRTPKDMYGTTKVHIFNYVNISRKTYNAVLSSNDLPACIHRAKIKLVSADRSSMVSFAAGSEILFSMDFYH